jgi:hypothetical protein
MVPLTRIPGVGQYVERFSVKVAGVFEEAAASLAQNPVWYRSFLSGVMLTNSRNIRDLRFENATQWQKVTSAGTFLSAAGRDFLDNAGGRALNRPLGKARHRVIERNPRNPLRLS